MSDDTEHGPAEDGVVIELARDDVARKKFLKMAGKGMGAAAAASGLSAFIAACGSSSSKSSTQATTASSPSTATASSPSTTGTASTSTGTSTTAATTVPSSFGSGDLGIVNYALTLEYLEADFYKKVIASGLFSGMQLDILKTFGKEEAEHVKALHKAAMSLGTPAPKPKAKFPLTSASSVATLAGTVENLGAAAYLGQAANIKDPAILAAALAIHTIEARHAATLNIVLKMDPTPDGAFAKPASPATVLAAVKPFIVS